MAYAQKRGGVWWIGYVDATGEPMRRKTRATTQEEAIREAEEWQRREDLWRAAGFVHIGVRH